MELHQALDYAAQSAKDHLGGCIQPCPWCACIVLAAQIVARKRELAEVRIELAAKGRMVEYLKGAPPKKPGVCECGITKVDGICSNCDL